jgi:Fe-S oxidoreductase
MHIAMVCTPIVEWLEGELHPAYMDSSKNNPHLGPYLLASVLKKEGFDVALVDLVYLESIKEEVVKSFAYFDVISFSCNSTNWPTCRLLIQWTKKNFPEKIVILGGIHATLFGEDLAERYPMINFLIRGEGEKSLPSLLRAIDNKEKLTNVPGLICKINGKVISNPPAALLNSGELDALPVPLYDQMPKRKYQALSIESSRGCKGACTFCSIPYQKSWRSLSSKGFVDNVEILQSYIPDVEKKYFSVVDDCFTIDHKRIFEILNEVKKRNIDFQATYDARIKDFIDEKLVSELAPHTKGVLLGAESFLPETLKQIHKPISESEILRCAANAEKYGIAKDTIFSFIIGFPWETKSQVQQNIAKISDLAVNYGIRVFLQWHTLTPGSQIWRGLYRQGKVLSSDLDEIGFLVGEKWFNISSSLSIEDRLNISDMVTCIQKVIAFTKPFGSKRGDIEFMIPPYLIKNRSLTESWVFRYQERMEKC